MVPEYINRLLVELAEYQPHTMCVSKNGQKIKTKLTWESLVLVVFEGYHHDEFDFFPAHGECDFGAVLLCSHRNLTKIASVIRMLGEL